MEARSSSRKTTILKMAMKISFHAAYGGIALFISLLNNIFLLYYVDTFVNVYKIDRKSFWIGEAVFLVWNSLNDPLFGWMSDRKSLSSTSDPKQRKSLSTDIVLKRIRSLNKYGPLFALSFLSFWFPLVPPAIQFVICLCLYDGFLTMVDLHHQALLADMAITAADRTKLNSYCSLCSAFGAASVFISYAVWNKSKLLPFRTLCLTMACAVAVGFFICCSVLRWEFEDRKDREESMNYMHIVSHESTHDHEKPISAVEYSRQLLKQKNFLWFALMNLTQVFHCHFNSNFFPLFIERLLGHMITPTTGALILGISFLIPHINNLYFLSLCRKFGSYSVIKWLFCIKVVLAVTMWFLGPGWWILLCLFIASNRVFTEGTCKLLNLVISDLVDEDYVLHHRKTAISALIFGMAALLSKPGQTLAPLLGTWFLFLETGNSVFFDEKSKPVLSTAGEADQRDKFRTGCFNVLVYVPVVCGLLQLFAWSNFRLRGKRLSQVKSLRAGLESKSKEGLLNVSDIY